MFALKSSLVLCYRSDLITSAIISRKYLLFKDEVPFDKIRAGNFEFHSS